MVTTWVDWPRMSLSLRIWMSAAMKTIVNTGIFVRWFLFYIYMNEVSCRRFQYIDKYGIFLVLYRWIQVICFVVVMDICGYKPVRKCWLLVHFIFRGVFFFFFTNVWILILLLHCWLGQFYSWIWTQYVSHFFRTTLNGFVFIWYFDRFKLI